jgi:hypothetical protein
MRTTELEENGDNYDEKHEARTEHVQAKKKEKSKSKTREIAKCVYTLGKCKNSYTAAPDGE